MTLIVIGLIVAVIIIANQNSSLKKENLKLKTELQKYRQNVGYLKEEKVRELQESSVVQTKTTVAKPVATTANQNVQKVKQVAPKTNEQTKNTLILVAGAVLIVLAAIIFLTSTWNAIPNFIKTVTLVLLIGVFFGTSRIAKDKFKLEQASNTFFAIAMAFIPIVLISISVFELLGHYLSWYGEGNLIYFGVSSIVLSSIYLASGIRRKSRGLIVSGLITQTLAVLFMTLAFTTKFQIVLLVFSIYSLIVIQLLNKLSLAKYNKMTEIYNYVILGITTGIFVMTILITQNTTVIHIITALILTVTYFTVARKIKGFTWTYFAGMLATVLTVTKLEYIELSIITHEIIFLCATVLVFLYGIEGKRNEQTKKPAVILSLVTIGLLYPLMQLFAFMEEEIVPNYVLIYLVVFIAFLTYKNAKVFRKAMTHIIPIGLLIAATHLVGSLEFNYSAAVVTFLITTLAMIVLEIIMKKENIKFKMPYVIISFGILFLILACKLTGISFFMHIVCCLGFIIYVKENKLNEYLNIIPFLSLIPEICFFDKELFLGIDLMPVVTVILVIGTAILSIKKKKINLYTIVSFVYLMLMICVFDINAYIKMLSVLAWGIIHIVNNKGKIKIPFLLLTYITGLVLYNTIISDIDLNLTDVTAINLLGYIVVGFAITRTILKKYTKGEDYKVVEYIISALIYLYAITSYTSQVDGMIFVFMLLVIMAIGYNYKYGPMFFTSIIAIILNGLVLTREFWFSIPWWIYLLVLGLVLITFAVNNEMNERKNTKQIKQKFKTLKDKVDM